MMELHKWISIKINVVLFLTMIKGTTLCNSRSNNVVKTNIFEKHKIIDYTFYLL